MKHSLRSKETGKFISRQPANVVPGRLYGYRGTVVRAGKRFNNGTRHVSFHKNLHGFVKDEQLELIARDRVENYLRNA